MDPAPDRAPPEHPPRSARPGASRQGWSWVLVGAIFAATAGALVIEGRRWWCACGQPWPWITDVWTSHCSQHLADPYSVTHVSHGLIFCGALAWLLPAWTVRARLSAALAVAAGWEILENSPLIIERYRATTMSLEYLGDSIGNAIGDVLACAIGFFIALRLGVVRSLILFAATELLLLLLMRDNLTLNVLMLIYPVPGIKAWQMTGHG